MRTRITSKTAMIPLAIMALTPLATFAQTPAEGGKKSGMMLEEVVVVARKVEQNLQEVPVAVTALNADQLQESSVLDLRDLSSIAPNLNITASGSGPQAITVSLRGQAQSGILITQDPSLGVYVDGFNNPRRLGLSGDLVDIQQVEVLRGPQGTLFGRNTTGGALIVTGNKPGRELSSELRVRVGDYEEFDTLGIFNVPLTDNIAARFVANAATRGPYAHDAVGRPLADKDTTYFRGKLLGEWDDLIVEVRAHYETYDSRGPMTVLTGLTPGADGAGRLQIMAELGLPNTEEGRAQASQAWEDAIYDGSGYNISTSSPQHSKSQSASFGVTTTWAMSDNWTLKSLTGYFDLDRKDQLDIDGTGFDIFPVTQFSDDTFISQEFQAIGSLDNIDIVAGLYADYEDGTDGGATIVIPAIIPNYSVIKGDINNHSIAAFSQANWHITDRLTATLGGRYTREEKKLKSYSHQANGDCLVPVSLRSDPDVCKAVLSDTYTDPSWLASLDYQLGDDAMVYGKVSQSPKAGGQNLRGRSEAGLEPFDPETATEYEIGFKSMLFDQRMRLNAAVFYDEYEDVQRQIVTGGGATTRVTNAAEATLYGAEVETTIILTEGLTVTAAVGYLDAEYDEFTDFSGDRSGQDWPAPDWTYSLATQYSVPVSMGDAIFQLSYQGQSKQNLYPSGKLTDQLTQSGYGLLNGAMRLRMDDYEVAFYARNITDELYYISGISIEALGYNILNLGSPRTFGVEFTAHFGG